MPRSYSAAALGLTVYDAAGLVAALMAMLSGIMNALGWSIVAIYLVFTAGYGHFQFVKPR